MSDTDIYPSASDKAYLDRAYALKSPDEARTLYDEWAKSYDTDLSGLDYAFPRRAAEAVLANLPAKADGPLKVLDAGCGTGLVGVALIQAAQGRAKFRIDGVDISPGMLETAQKTGLYADLSEVDLTKPLSSASSSYDIVVCVGTLTRGHVGCAVLAEFVRVTKGDGLVVATVLDQIWKSAGFEAEVERLSRENQVEVLSVGTVGVVEGKQEGGKLVVMRRLQ